MQQQALGPPYQPCTLTFLLFSGLSVITYELNGEGGKSQPGQMQQQALGPPYQPCTLTFLLCSLHCPCLSHTPQRLTSQPSNHSRLAWQIRSISATRHRIALRSYHHQELQNQRRLGDAQQVSPSWRA